MNSLKYLILWLSATVLCGCADTYLSQEAGNEALITGNTYAAMAVGNTPANTTSVFASGTEALFNATGGLVLENEVLTFSDGRWNGIHEPTWNETGALTQVTALHPVYADFAYNEENLYQEGALADVLYAQDTVAVREGIQLQFKHRFSLLTFQLSTRLQQQFKAISLTYPHTVAGIDPLSAALTLSDTEYTTTLTQASTDGRYSFIVPPAEDVTISLTVETTAQTYPARAIGPYSFVQGRESSYRVDSDEKTVGIATVEDFIAFSQLINYNAPETYAGKTLADFGETVDGITTYYLLNDLDFEGVDCSGLKQIGKSISSKYYFNHIFDGQEHTISNLTPTTGDGTTALFGAVGTEGVIRNLHIDSFKFKVTSTKGSKTGVAAVVGCNYGILTNCSVENSNIDSGDKGAPTGGLVGELRGTVINCYVRNTTITSTSSSGGITGSSKGNISNCYSINNNIIASDDSAGNSGGISGKSNTTSPTHIQNCYVYKLQLTGKNSRGLFYGLANNSTIEHCYYGANNISALIGINSGSSKDATNINNITQPLYELLNEWIGEDTTYTSWQQGDDDSPAIFIK